MSSKRIRDDYQTLAHAFAEEDAAAADLWTWLPSYAEAQKHHGDYASTFRPSLDQVMREASAVFAAQRYPESDHSADAWLHSCPCGEDHDAPADEEA